MNTRPENRLGEGTSPLPPADARVETSHPCRRCGYELRGLRVDGICPECGGLIARSLQGNLLAFAHPGFLRSLAAGAVMVVAAIVLICLVPIVVTVLRAVGGGYDILETRAGHAIVLTGAALASVGAGVLALVGWFTLTAPDPGFVGADSSSRARMATRWSTAILAGLLALAALRFIYPLVVVSSPTVVRYVYMIAPWVLAAALAVQAPSSLAYIAHIAERIPDAKLRVDARMVRRVTLALAVLVLAVFMHYFLHRSFRPMRGWTVRWNTGFRAISWIVGLMIVGLTVTVAVRYSDIIDRVRRHALRLARVSTLVEETESNAVDRNTLPR